MIGLAGSGKHCQKVHERKVEQAKLDLQQGQSDKIKVKTFLGTGWMALAIIVQVSIALLIFVFWGRIGIEWKYIVVVAVMAWSLGDAVAVLVGKKFGRRRFQHSQTGGAKTIEGTQAMFFNSGLAIFFTLFFFASQPWHVSLTVALLAAPLCAVVELFSNRRMDTLTMPISTGKVVLSLMSFFSFMGF